MTEQANQTVLIYNHLEMLSHFDHIPMGFMNRTNWVPQKEPLIEIPRAEWDEHQFVPEIRGNMEWVDIVVNNRDDKGHPFHLVRLLLFQVQYHNLAKNVLLFSMVMISTFLSVTHFRVELGTARTTLLLLQQHGTRFCTRNRTW
jgi:hypothetical protein